MNRTPGLLFLLPIFVLALAACGFFLMGPNPWLALLVPVGIPVLALLARYPYWGYYLMIALVPLDAWRVLSEEYRFLTISKFIGVWLVFVVFMRIVFEPRLFERLRSRIWYPLGIFFLINLISTIYCMDGQLALCFNEMRQLVTAYVFVALSLFFIRDERFHGLLPVVIIASTTLASFIAIVGHFFKIPGLVMMATMVEGGRVVGAASDPNFFAAMVLCALPLLAHVFVFAKSNRIRVGLAALFAINSLAIVLTYSRGVMLIFMLVLFLLAIEHGRHMRVRYIGFFVLAFAVLLAYGGYKLPKTRLWQRMATIMHPMSDPSMEARTSYLLVAIDALKKNPVLGSGPGTFPVHYSYSKYAPVFAREHTRSAYRRAAHNTYMEILVGTGPAGAIAFGALLLTCFWFFYRAQSALNLSAPRLAGEIRALAICFVAILASFVFLSNLYHKYIWLFVGLAGVAVRLAAPSERVEE